MSDDTTNTELVNSTAKHVIGRLLVIGVLAGLVYVWRPLFHGLIYGMAFNPGILIAVGIPLVIGVLLFIAPPFKGGEGSSLQRKGTVFGIVIAGALVIAIIYSIPAGMVQQETLADRTMANAEEVDSFPQVNEQNPRVIPRGVADTQSRGSVSYRQHQLGTSDIARTENGSLAWSYPIQPGPFRVQVSGNQRGIYMYEMTRVEDKRVVAADSQDFTYGQNMLLHRSADWNIKKSGGYWSAYNDDAISFTHNGTAYMAYPKTGHEWKLGPIPHTVPVWDGVALVHPDGTIDHLSPEEAQESEILDGQRIYPFYNARVEAQSLEYRNGIINQLPIVGSYEGVVEPATIPNTAGNAQPFVIDTEEHGMVYVMAMEPHGASSRGLDEVWFYDADTSERLYFGTGDDLQLFGPERAMDIVRSQDSQTGWVATTEGGNFKVVEPIPTFIDGDLWWHAKVVTADDSDVARSVFVNADTKEAVAFTSTDRISQFIGGDTDIEGNMTTTEPSQNDENDIAYYIVIKDDQGNVVDRIPVRNGQETTIEQATGNSTATNSTG